MIKVIDAPCGAGKTTWAIQTMRNDIDTPFVYCTPYLDEIKRVREACGTERFREPKPYGKTKIEDFNDLLSEGTNICVTHTTFLNCTEESIRAIYEGEYTLILDETLDVVSEFNDVCDDGERIKPGDPALMISKGMISIDEARHNKVVWVDENWDDTSFSGVKRFAELGRLYCVDNKLLVAVFPPEVFGAFVDIYVLTYYIEGTTLHPYFKLFDLEYEKKSVRESDGVIELTDWTCDAENTFKRLCREKVKVCEDEIINRSKRKLSKNWYDNANREAEMARFKELKADIQRFLRSVSGVKSKDIMITCPKDSWRRIKGKGYSGERALTREEKSLPETTRKHLEKQLSCFVPCNARGTNDYRERWCLIYAFNMYLNPEIKKLFTTAGVEVDEEKYSLSCLIQWISRSRLRDGRDVTIYIPSQRMRRIFQNWRDDI